MILALLAATLTAEDLTALKRAKFRPGPPPYLEVVLQQELTQDSDLAFARTISNWSVLDVASNQTNRPSRVKVESNNHIVELIFNPAVKLPCRCVLVTQNLTFGGKPTKDPVESIAAAAEADVPPPTPPSPPPTSSSDFKPAKNRDDANYYFGGQLILHSARRTLSSALMSKSGPSTSG